MAKRKGRKRDLAQGVADIAERHGFDAGGLLGHDSTYNVNVSEHVLLAVDTAFACVRTIADLTADAQVGEYRGNELLQPSRIVRRPMATVTRRTWLWQCAATMAIYSGVYLWDRFDLRDDEGVPISLEPVAPSRINWTGPDNVWVDGIETRPELLRWVPRMTFPTLDRASASVIRLARDAMAAAYSADAYRADYWQKGGAPSWYVSASQPIGGNDAADIKAKVVEKRTSAPGEPMVLGKGAEIKTIGTDLAAAGASDALGRMGISIARYFGVPGWLVNVASEAGSLTYANASAAGLDLVRYTLQPGYAGPIGDALSDYLPGDYIMGRRVVLGLSHLTRGTILEQAQAYQISTGGRPWQRPSEVRAELHMAADDTLDLDPQGASAPALESIPAGRGMSPVIMGGFRA